VIQAAVDQLLALKAEFKAVTGTDYGPPPVVKPVEEKVYYISCTVQKLVVGSIE